MEKILSHKRYYKSKVDSIDKWGVSLTEKKSVHKYIGDYESGKITGRIGSNVPALIVRLLDYLRCLEHINKDEPIKADIEKFFDSLIKNKIKRYNPKTKKYNGEPYSLKTKKSICEALAKYYAWKFPDKPEILMPLKIKLSSKRDDYKFLTLDEIDRLYRNCENDEKRYFISVLFSSGCRIEEFLNIRYSDITLPKGEENFVKLRLRKEFSKTEGRTINLYYQNSLEAVRDFLKQRESEGIKPEEPVYQKQYTNLKQWLTLFGTKVLNKRISCHVFRHSCATWLASRLNRQQMCIFFGWQFSSNMVDRYISRNGVDMVEIDNKFSATELEEVKKKLSKQEFESKMKLEKQEYENKMMSEQLSSLSKKIELLARYKDLKGIKQ